MTPDELLFKHGIKLTNSAPGRYYTTCPNCSATRSKAHQDNKVLGVTIEPNGSIRWGCNHCGWTGPEKGTGNGQQQEPATPSPEPVFDPWARYIVPAFPLD